MTGLPADNSPWPPPSEAPRYDRMRVTSTWYSGDPDRLSTLYINGYGGAEVVNDGVLKKAVLAVRRFFWGTESTLLDRSTKIHVPIAEDIATRSSELLFAEGLTIRVDGPVEEEDVTEEVGLPEGTPPELAGNVEPEVKVIRAKGQPKPATAAAQKRLEEILDKTNFHALLLAAAETQSPLGSVGLRVAWDKDIDPKRPFIARVDADAVVTEYRWGRLVAVTFWRTIHVQGETYTRHLERHEVGRIYHGVYKGSLANLGKAQPLVEFPNAFPPALLEELVMDPQTGDQYIPVDSEYRFATSIPNMLPDPLDRMNAAGRSDLTPGVITMMDAIDEIATSLMRDIELAKGRLIVADYMLEDNGPGKGSTFNPETKLFSPVKMAPSDEGEAPITIVQFKIRVEEHIKSAEWFINQAMRAAGYNLDADMGQQGGDMTATEFSGKNKRSLSTRDKKIMYWQPALEELLEALLVADRDNFNSGIEVFPVKVEFPDAVQPDLRMLAETVELMRRAEAASLQVIVETLHPDWDAKEVKDEVERIQEETSVVDPNTFGLSPQPPTIVPGGLNPSADPQQPPVQPEPTPPVV